MTRRGTNVAIKCVPLLTIFFIGNDAVNGHTPAINYEVTSIALPDSNGVVVFDHLAYDRATGRLWVPASNTGNVDVKAKRAWLKFSPSLSESVQCWFA
jgi:hypothetical protein